MDAPEAEWATSLAQDAIDWLDEKIDLVVEELEWIR
jgi:hypothetical protein